MPAVSPASVRRALDSGTIALVYYLTGDVEILKDDLIAEIIDRAVDPANRDFNCETRSAADLDAESLHALIETPPMLAERRVAVVRSIEQWRKNSKPVQTLHAYLANPSPTTTLILVQGSGSDADAEVSRHATHVKVDNLGGEALRDWILGRTARAGLTIDPAAADHLAAAVGGDLSQIAIELQKLEAAVADGQPITVKDVEHFVGVRHGETLADWVDAAIHRRVAEAVTLMHAVLPQAGMSPVKMLNSLGTALVGTRLARTLLDEGKPPKATEQHIFQTLRRARVSGLGRYSEVASAWTRAADCWAGHELDQAIVAAYEADQQLKSTTITDAPGTITTMLLRLITTKETA